jgi:hypothetical protein
MPYIKQDNRAKLEHGDGWWIAENAGELNFQFTDLIIDYICAHGLNYQRINDVMGALEGAKAEFYRRVAAPYEDKKIKENGDVYPEKLL